MTMANDAVKLCGGLLCLFAVVSVITVLASIRTVKRNEQLVVEYLSGKEVYNGPLTKVTNPFRDKYVRKGVKLSAVQYAVVKNALTGEREVHDGPKVYMMTAYEDLEDKIQRKFYLRQDQYIRFVDRLTGEERVVKGARSVAPKAWEESPLGVQQAAYVDLGTAVVVANKATGQKRLVTQQGVFFPDPYEVVEDTRQLTSVAPHETVVVRNAYGRFVVYSGASGSSSVTGAGMSFFLAPYERIMDFTWSTFGEPTTSGDQAIGKVTFQRIDMRARKVFFQYDVHTNDNVALRIDGAIFWKVVDVSSMLSSTADAAGDVYYKARSALIAGVSQVDLESFMQNFQTICKNALKPTSGETFYQDRGLEVTSIEVTKYDPIDTATAATLQEIIEETTNRINQLQVQRSENDVLAAKLVADIKLEKERTQLIQTQSKNDRLLASREGEAEGVELAKAATSFLDGLNETLPDIDARLDLYTLHKQLETQNTRTGYIASGRATTLFLSPEDLQMDLTGAENQEL